MAKRKAEDELENESKRQKLVPLSEKKLEYLNADKSSWFLTWKLEPEQMLSEDEFNQLWDSHPKERPRVKLFGEFKTSPRWSQCFGKTYFYSGVLHKEIPFTPLLQRYLDYANSIRKCEFNMCLVNWYQNGLDCIGSHSDNEPQIDTVEDGSTKILSISFGQERAFYFTPKKEANKKENPNNFQSKVNLDDGSVLLMCGLTQKTHNHSLPKIIGAKGEAMGKRISLTFRKFK